MNSPYSIEIRGTGPHHSQPSIVVDADRVAAFAALTLSDNGHTVTSARFVSDAHTDDIRVVIGLGKSEDDPLQGQYVALLRNELNYTVQQLLEVSRILEAPPEMTMKDVVALARLRMKELREKA